MINARTLHDELNVFRGVGKGGLFGALLATMVVCQLLIVQALAPVFKIVPQSLLQWLQAIVLGAGSLVVALLVKIVSRQSIVITAVLWLAGSMGSAYASLASCLGAGARTLGVRRGGGAWTRLEAAPVERMSVHVLQPNPLKGSTEDPALPLSHSSQEAGLRPTGSVGSQRNLMPSGSRQWGCWSTLTGAPVAHASGSGAFSRQASSLSTTGIVELVTVASGAHT